MALFWRFTNNRTLLGQGIHRLTSIKRIMSSDKKVTSSDTESNTPVPESNTPRPILPLFENEEQALPEHLLKSNLVDIDKERQRPRSQRTRVV